LIDLLEIIHFKLQLKNILLFFYQNPIMAQKNKYNGVKAMNNQRLQLKTADNTYNNLAYDTIPPFLSIFTFLSILTFCFYKTYQKEHITKTAPRHLLPHQKP